MKSTCAVFHTGRLSDSGTSVGFPCGFTSKSPNNSSNFFLPSILVIAVMPSTLCSYGSNPAACTASAAAVSLQYARLALPSTSFQFFHVFPCKDCCKAYSLISEAHATSWSAVSKLLQFRYRSACPASQNHTSPIADCTPPVSGKLPSLYKTDKCSPAQKSPSPLAASSAFGFSSVSAQCSSSDSDSTFAEVLDSRLKNHHPDSAMS